MSGQTTPIHGLDMAVNANPCVTALKNILVEAEAGRVTSVAIIAITPQSQVATLYAGGQRGDLFVGTAMLQKGLLEEMQAPQKRPSIIPA